MNPKISADHLKRRAIIYIRQSSPGQVIHNQESQRRQYGLADHARQLGFQNVEIIDADLGRSGPAKWSGLDSNVWLPRSAQAKWVPCSVLKRPGWHATVATGITSSDFAVWCEQRS